MRLAPSGEQVEAQAVLYGLAPPPVGPGAQGDMGNIRQSSWKVDTTPGCHAFQQGKYDRWLKVAFCSN